MTPPLVLIVDHDAAHADVQVRLLQAQGWRTKAAVSATSAEMALSQHQPAVVLLEATLPDAPGLLLCQRWRQAHPTLGIVVLSAQAEVMDRVLGLELGADEFLHKPFEPRELVARLRALLRRCGHVPASRAVLWEFGALSLHLVRREVRMHGQAVALTSTEFKLLVALARQPGVALSRHQLSSVVQAGAYRPMDRTVDVQVGRLRRRLAVMAPETGWIETVRGEGYAFVPRARATT